MSQESGPLPPITQTSDNQAQRRGLVIALYGLLAGSGIWYWTARVVQTRLPGIDALVLILYICAFVAVVSSVSIFLMTLQRVRITSLDREPALQEQWRQVRSRAHRVAFHILTGVITVGFMALVVVGQDAATTLMVTPGVTATALATFVALIMTLPTAVVAWQAPDQRAMQRMSELERRLDMLDTRVQRWAELERLTRAGERIQAVKVYREDTGASLDEAVAAQKRLKERLLQA